MDSKEFYISHDGFGAEVRGKIFHGFFGCKGGVSDGIFASLNCGVGSSDNPESVNENRERVLKSTGGDRLLGLYQVHGNECVTVHRQWDDADKPKADAFVTDRAGIALGILTADCAPVLFYGEKAGGAPVIGAAHAGWGGAFKGILSSCVDGMEGLGAVRSSIKACIGPCIAQSSYEVGQEFLDRFLDQDEAHRRFFMPSQNLDHYLFDLGGFCALRLDACGIAEHYNVGIDTYINEADYFSYRRATHHQEPDYGRQISVISIGN
ncbi:MAG: peptidoglycan editing factor PgeF [Micavibrio sp.]|nr:peptidoglycan editing factor PgeF [Micavibrio sp.]